MSLSSRKTNPVVGDQVQTAVYGDGGGARFAVIHQGGKTNKGGLLVWIQRCFNQEPASEEVADIGGHQIALGVFLREGA